MLFQNTSNSFGRKLTLLVTFAILVPLVIFSILLTVMLGGQMNTVFKNRLEAGLKACSIAFESRTRSLDKELTTLATDNTLQLTLDLEINSQLHNYVESRLDVRQFSTLQVLNSAKENVASVGDTIPFWWHEDSGIFATDKELYLCKHTPIYRDEDLLGYIMVAAKLTDTRTIGHLQSVLVDNFIIWFDQRAYVTDLDQNDDLKDWKISAHGEMTSFLAGKDHYKILTRSMNLGNQIISFSLLLPYDEIINSFLKMISIIGAVMVFVFLFVLLILKRYAKSLISPVTALTMAAKAAGESAEDIPPLDTNRNDEFGVLNRTFQTMRMSLQKHIKTIEINNQELIQSNQKIEAKNMELMELSSTLEKRVAERTTDLVSTNEKLEKEIIERKQAEEDKSKLEEQVRQSQKMEAIGNLAGGVAHDFNNLLTAINGHSQMLLDKLPPENESREPVSEILEAGKRAASLTRQLLTFSRKQVITPKALDLNHIVLSTQKMIGRLIGEHIKFKFHPGKDLGTIKADSTQMEQVLINMAVNSRDAMPDGGSLIMETSSIELDESFCEKYTGVKPGRFIMLTISDTGIGMDKETCQKIFDPFFTTKERGKGTGMGLATVYGILKQSGGFITTYSELEIGTTFKIYLPMSKTLQADEEKETPSSMPQAGTETILLVEDEPLVLRLTSHLLNKLGYKVLTAPGGSEAIEVSNQNKNKIDLVLTDVIMPEMNGAQLAKHLQELQPEIKVLFMSGYTEEIIDQHGILDVGIHFIHKPFTMPDLSQKLREALAASPKTNAETTGSQKPA